MARIIYELSKLPSATREMIEGSERYRDLFSKFPDKLFGLGGDAKTSKGEKLGFKTAIIYLIPANGSGVNLCALAALAACDAPCLVSAGRGVMSNVYMGRLRKTLYFLQYREAFLNQANRELDTLKEKAKREGWTLLVRLNGTSDIRYENLAFGNYANIFEAHQDVQFYDYTKLPNRRDIPGNYDLTFSYSGVAAYRPFVEKAKLAGMRIAVVFRSRAIVERMLANGETFEGMALVDGDDTDVRHIDPHGVVVALYAKGKAKVDTSGFVVG